MMRLVGALRISDCVQVPQRNLGMWRFASKPNAQMTLGITAIRPKIFHETWTPASPPGERMGCPQKHEVSSGEG